MLPFFGYFSRLLGTGHFFSFILGILGILAHFSSFERRVYSMADILKTILPIFVIIFLGWSLRRLDFMQEGFVKPANRLVYFVAIPAMIFREIATAELAEHFRLVLVAATLSP